MSPRASRWITVVLACVTVGVLVLSIPSALRDAYEHGGIYMFSREFIDDIPRRLAGPGRMRFIVQPTVAMVLGIIAGRRDSRAGRAPFLLALILGRGSRRELVGSVARDTVNLVLMGVLMDAVSQKLILGMVHPGVALVVGPVLITGPYVVARAFANRATTAVDKRRGK